ncbi:glycosyltransferase family 2 protein [Carnobacterium sp. TMP28]|uniref:glycosyltransferase family 2 protein n=1 Tax=Carnobacterium sp. TMP28 TaxID=3397060 RepID=UPI0039E1FDAE
MKNKKIFIYWLAGISAVVYLMWRAFYTLPLDDSLFALIVGVLLLFSEVISSFTAFILIWSKHKYRELIKPEIETTDYPDVDVFIATHNEEYELLYMTVNGCTFMDYPDKSKVHIYICDDKNRPEISALAKEFGITHLGVENNTHAKSGNLNYALSQTRSPLIATFDADMIPYSGFLIETVPYFIGSLEDGEKPIGLVQTPQSFYNADLFQYNLFAEESIPNEQDFFSREVNVLNNAHDCAIYTGSNTLISRQAIEEAGGFPTNTITEDFQLGVAINTCGYKTISTIEPMASGLTPKDIPGVLKQRIRWARGVLKSVYNMKVLVNKKLTLAQRIVFTNSYLYWWSFSRRLLYIMAPILFTVFDVRIVATNFWVLVLFWLPSYVLLKLAMKDVTSDIRSERWGEIQETIFAPYLVIPVFLESIGLSEKTFKVTNKTTEDSKMDRLFVLPHLILLILSIIGLVKFNYGKFGMDLFYGSVISFWLLHHILNLTFAVLYCFKRPFYRTNERFLLEEEITVQQNGKSYALKTENLSEDGLSFKSTYPIYFDTSKELLLEVRTAKYKTHLTGKIVRVVSKAQEWSYGVSIERPNRENFNQYLQIMHDRFNQYLPQKRDIWMTPADELIEILVRRLKLIQKEKGPGQIVQATIDLNEEVSLFDQKATLIQFDFEFIYFRTPHKLPLAEEGIFDYQGVLFTLLFDHFVTKESIYCFKVVNLTDIAQEEEFLTMLVEWGNKG